MAQALENSSWVHDIRGGLSLIGLWDYFHLWDLIEDFILSEEEDQHIWKLSVTGQFSTKTAYHAFFLGSIQFEPWKLMRKTWAPGKCKMFVWLAIKNCCWTADRLAKRGLSHMEKCMLCDQEEEHIQHILTTCVFARQFWCQLFVPLD